MRLLLASTFAHFDQKLDEIEGFNLSDYSVLCIPTAALFKEPHDWLKDEITPIKARAKSYVELDIAGKSEEEVSSAVQKADVVYSPGGNTYCLLEAMRACNFAKIIQTHLDHGRIYMGGSAGAIVMCPDIDYVRSVEEVEKSSIIDYTGLNLVDFYILPHIDGKSFKEPIRNIVKQTKNIPLVGLRDDQAIFIRDNYQEIY